MELAEIWEKREKNTSDEREIFRNQAQQQELHQSDKQVSCLPCKILGTFL